MGESRFFCFFFYQEEALIFTLPVTVIHFCESWSSWMPGRKKNMFESFVGILRNLRIGGKIKRNMLGMMFIAICFFFFSQSKWKKKDKNGKFKKNNNLVAFSKSSWSANMPYEFIRPQRNIFDELKIAFRIPKTQALDSPLKCCGSVRRLCENTLHGKKWMSWKNTSTEDHT